MKVLLHSRAVGLRQPEIPAGRAGRVAAAMAIAAVTWGVLAFGAVYPWAYWPLAAACLVCGFAGLLARRERRQGFSASLTPMPGPCSRGLTIAFAVLAGAVLLQLIPVPGSWLVAISPNTVAMVRDLDPMFAAGLTTAHTFSLDPYSTWVGLALYASLATFFFGLTRLLSLTGARRVAEMLTILAVVVALIGIVHKPAYGGRIYGFWTTVGEGDPFGPFVNKNHFAGWMLLALPVTLGLLCAGFQRGLGHIKPDWRSRLLWLSSPEANRLILLAASAIVMALALVMTMSRSGITAFAIAILITAGFVVRAEGPRSRKVAIAAYLLILAITVTGWVGVDAIARRFSTADWSEFNNRKGAWTDALSVVRAVPAVGTGLNTYGKASLFYQRHDLESHYEQAHNDYLQVAAEGGALLVLPAAACLILLVRDVRRQLRKGQGSTGWWLRAGATTSLVAMAFQETVDFSLQIPGNAALFAVICAIALHDPSSYFTPSTERSSPQRERLEQRQDA